MPEKPIVISDSGKTGGSRKRWIVRRTTFGFGPRDCGDGHLEHHSMVSALAMVLLWFSAIGCGLLAGLYFAFSTFVMTALGRIAQEQGVAAMQAINATILRSLFIPFFLGTTLTSLALAVVAIFRWGEPGAATMLAGGVIYVIGMFAVTAVFNVPLNNALAAVDPASAEAAQVWARYLKDWTMWNHVRTLASIAACALFIAALIASHHDTR